MHAATHRSIQAVQHVDDASSPELLAARLLAELAVSVSGGLLSQRTSTEGKDGVTIPIGAVFYSYSAVGGTITVSGITRPDGVSNSVTIPGGLAAAITIANGTGVAHWSYVA